MSLEGLTGVFRRVPQVIMSESPLILLLCMSNLYLNLDVLKCNTLNSCPYSKRFSLGAYLFLFFFSAPLCSETPVTNCSFLNKNEMVRFHLVEFLLYFLNCS